MSAARPRLALLVKTFPKVSETFVLNEILALERAGLDLEIFALRRPTETVRQPAVALVRAPVHYLDDAPRVAAAGAGDVAASAVELALRLRERGFGHVHAHFVDHPGAVAERAAQLAGITFSLSAHARDIYLCDTTTLRRRLASAAFTVTCTGFNASWLADAAPRGSVIRCVYHGIDARNFAPCCARAHARAVEDSPAILAVGRLRPKKGFATLVDACRLLQDRGLPFRCDIVGYGEQQAALAARIAGLGLDGRVQLRGRMTHDELIHLYRAATVFAMPCEVAADGDRDGIPNSLLEAMALELPVVTTPVSGIPEIVVDGRNGLLVPPADAARLADALAQVIDHPAAARVLGRMARRTVIEHFDEDDNVRALVDLLEPLLAVPASRPGRREHACA